MARQRGKKWQADALHQGKRHRPSFDTREEAEAWEAQVALAESRGHPLPPHRSGSGDQTETIRSFISKHFQFLWGDVKAPQAPKANLEQIVRVLGPNLKLVDLDYNTILETVEVFRKEGNSNATINRKMASLSKLLRHAERVGVIPKTPSMPRFREAQGRVRFFTREEEQAICDRLLHLGLIESYHFVRFLMFTGARRGEAERLERRDVDLRANMVTFWETKANKPRSVPLTTPAREAVVYNLSANPESTNPKRPTQSRWSSSWASSWGPSSRGPAPRDA